MQLPADAKASPVITGSPAQAATYAQQWQAITQKAGPIYEMLKQATPAGTKEAAPEARKEADARFAALDAESKQTAEAFVQAHPNSVVFPNYDEASKLSKQLGLRPQHQPVSHDVG